MRAVVWWLVGGPYIFGLMLAPAGLIAGVVALPVYLAGGAWPIVFAAVSVLIATLLAIYLVDQIIIYEKETENGGTY